MINIAICDDNELSLEIINEITSDFLLERSEETAVSLFGSGEELIESVRNGKKYQIYILDMIMPGIHGMEVASMLRMMKEEGKIVFLTASVDYAVQSYDVEASAYLLKPIDVDKFRRIMNKLLIEAANMDDEHSVVIKAVAESVKINPATICYVTVENRKAKYVLRDGRVLMGQTIRGRFADEVGDLCQFDYFVNCGLSHLINLRQVDAVSDESILMKNGDMLFPSRSSIRPFEQAWRSFLKW